MVKKCSLCPHLTSAQIFLKSVVVDGRQDMELVLSAGIKLTFSGLAAGAPQTGAILLVPGVLFVLFLLFGKDVTSVSCLSCLLVLC